MIDYRTNASDYYPTTKTKPPLPSPVTFIVGNGFDLHFQMKTRYRDVYATYTKTESSSHVLESLKKELNKKEPYDKWSDFETGMAEYASQLTSPEEFVECARDFKKHMIQHLLNEDTNIANKIKEFTATKENIARASIELRRSLSAFYEHMFPRDKNLIRQLINPAALSGHPLVHHVISFNYTRTMEKLLEIIEGEESSKSEILHIHGRLPNDVVLGVDNPEQLKNLNYKISNQMTRTFIKTIFNQRYDPERVERAKKMISRSNLICTYGFSFGKSDETWVKLLADCLSKNRLCHLVVFQHDELIKPEKALIEEMMDVEEEKKRRFFGHLGVDLSQFEDRIHIPVGRAEKIFNIPLFDNQI